MMMFASRSIMAGDLQASAQTRPSAEELVRLYRDGRLTDAGRVADLLMLAHLLNARDPLFVAL